MTEQGISQKSGVPISQVHAILKDGEKRGWVTITEIEREELVPNKNHPWCKSIIDILNERKSSGKAI